MRVRCVSFSLIYETHSMCKVLHQVKGGFREIQKPPLSSKMVLKNYHLQGPRDKSSTSFNMCQTEALPGEVIMSETKVWMSGSQA